MKELSDETHNAAEPYLRSWTRPQSLTTLMEIILMTVSQLVMALTGHQGINGIGMTNGMATLTCLNAMHVVTTHHPETTHCVVALLSSERTDNNLTVLLVRDMYASIPAHTPALTR